MGNEPTQKPMIIIRVKDEVASTTTAVIENLDTLVRNYITNYSQEKLEHIATQLKITVQAKIDQYGELEKIEPIEKRLNQLIDEYTVKHKNIY